MISTSNTSLCKLEVCLDLSAFLTVVYIVNNSLRLVLYERGPHQVFRDNSYRSFPLRNKSSLHKIFENVVQM